MNVKLEEALTTVEMSYQEIVEIGEDILKPIFSPIDDLISVMSNNINNLSIDQIRDYILRLQLKAFEISDIKEKSAIKAELAIAIQKERFATEFTGADGTAAAKDKIAQLATSQETVAEILYNLIANRLKTKLDQLHRLVDSLKSILMSRMQESKFMQSMSIGEKNEKTYLTE